VESDYSISGTPITLLAIGIFNGVIWGIIIFIIFWVLDSYVFKKEPTATVKVKATT
jgi:Mg/Co/Ni transporter MgtE